MDYFVFILLALAVIAVCAGVYNSYRKKKMLIAGSINKDEYLVNYAYYALLGHVDSLVEILQNVNQEELSEQERAKYEKLFVANIEKIAVNGWCLAYINNFPHLLYFFLSNIKEPDKNLKFQKLLISVEPAMCFPNFRDLLFHYAERWQLLPEVAKVLESDECFLTTRRIYENARKYALD